MLLNCGVGEDSWESLGLPGDPTSPSWRRLVLVVHWKEWCWSWNSNILVTWWEELTHWKRPWCWEGLGAEGEGDDRGWDVWMASPTRWAWAWVISGSWWWTGRPGMLRFMGSQSVEHDWATELNCDPCDQCGWCSLIEVFILSTFWWTRTRGLWKLPDGRDWLWMSLSLALMGRAMLSKYLIQFSVYGWVCLPSL